EPRIEEIIEEDMPRNDDVLRRYAKSGNDDSQSQIVELLVYSRNRKAAANDDTVGENAGVNQDIKDNAPL
nr:hypothetical protein [Tanacetum cinerariifolium]